MEVQFDRYQKNILQEWSTVKNLSCVSCAAWNVFPINSLFTPKRVFIIYIFFNQFFRRSRVHSYCHNEYCWRWRFLTPLLYDVRVWKHDYKHITLKQILVVHPVYGFFYVKNGLSYLIYIISVAKLTVYLEKIKKSSTTSDHWTY